MNKLTSIAAGVLAMSSFSALADGSITGLVTDASGILSGAKISVVGTKSKTSTDHQGQFNLSRLPAGKYTLRVEYLGYPSSDFDITVVDGEILDLGSLSLNINEATMEEVVAVGHMRRGAMMATNMQKESDNIKNVMSADGIGKLPDRNAAEAVQRMPGVSIERDQGEGRFVAIRGLPSQWNSTSMNGDRLPTAEEETTSRAVAFDFFPTDMIELVEVSKAITPDMEGDAIGGNINFVTRRAPDERMLSVNVGVGGAEKAEGGSYSFNMLYGDRSEDDKFGFLINATAWERDWATDNYEPRRAIDDDGIAGVHRLELRDYTGTRKTYGLNMSGEYLLDNGLVYASAMYGTLSDEETHYKHRVRYNKNRVELQHIYDELITEMKGFELGGEYDIDFNTRVEWKLSTYDNQFEYGDIPNGEDNAYYVVKFKQGVEFDNQVGVRNGQDVGSNLVYNTIDGGTDPARGIGMHLPSDWVMDPDKAVLADVELYGIDIQERDKIVAQLDLIHTYSDQLELKTGFKYRDKERNANFYDKFYGWNEEQFGPTPTLSQVAKDLGVSLVDQPGRGEFLDNFSHDYQKHFSQVIPVNDLKRWWGDNKHKLNFLDGDSEVVANGGGLSRNFDLEESHLSLYGMSTYKPSEYWTVVGGVRATQTKTDVYGYVAVENDQGTSVEPEQGGKDYWSVLPSVHVTYHQDDMTNVRFALTRTFARPDFGQLSPGATYLEMENQLRAGNPELDPTYSNNVDLMYEHYFDDAGVIAVGYFYKQIIDPVFSQSYQGSYRGNSVTVKSPLNGDDAWLHGVEFTANSSLAFINESLDDFGMSFNFTLMDSEMEIPNRSDKVKISRQADELYNVALYYDDGNFAARIAVNHKGEYIEDHGSNTMLDTYYGDYTSVDATASYYINDNAMIYIELNNLTDEPLQYFTGSERRPNQIEYYGIRGQVGFKYDFF
ncbi:MULTISPECIES: TonB-dependent receptor [Pseudoalteromonas]|uniref:TonB-dependent receptor n=1 Tax=Pseudoalteromonas obscura TaxID=3048491 RepID=A0ABT7ELN3_9GAMM|nr:MULTISPECIES: TonB-dependent receptor [Pseudoalteromonas]MBQ4837479.1 TonB-dependent receptor [Pseudoalteromonas luteoviolacea]MDK2595941.1 TonB-dependent receptor [Pseudoalteromonas sp. P94(2023)]